MATIQKRGNSYRITVSYGYDARGKQIRHTKTWVPSPGMTKKQIEKELTRRSVLFEEECHQGKALNGNIKFEIFAKQWFTEYAELTLKSRTVSRYHQYEKRTYAAIGHLRVDKITSRTIQKFILNLSEDGVNKTTGGKLAPKTVKNYLSFISSIFQYAISQGMIKDNPCRQVTLPAAKPIERTCYTLEEAQYFLELLENEDIMWRCFFVLAIYGGFRRGELYGLEWKDINFDTGVITINRTSLYTKEKGIFTDTPKTKQSMRSLKLPLPVISLLKQYKFEQIEHRLSVGDQWIDTDRLFVNWQGVPLHPSSAQNWLNRFCKRTDIRKVNIHSFRHLNATLLINNGTDIKTVSSALGHAQVSTTLNIYAHTFAQAQAQATEAIAETLKLKKNF